MSNPDDDEMEDYGRGARFGCCLGVVLSAFAALVFFFFRWLHENGWI